VQRPTESHCHDRCSLEKESPGPVRLFGWRLVLACCWRWGKVVFYTGLHGE
jgi:hypothetical protein